MIHTPVCDLLGIRLPIILGGMARATSAPLVAAVSHAGGLGTLGAARMSAEEVQVNLAAIRSATGLPFAVNFLMFMVDEAAFESVLENPPAVISFAWWRQDQKLAGYIEKAHAAGAKVMCMAAEVAEGERAAREGADVVVAQGTEGCGHVGWMSAMPLVPMMVDAVHPVPVLAAGGIADGRGLAAALALGAQGVLLGTRFLATQESPLHPNLKHAILASDGHDTAITSIPDIALNSYWPGAMARTRRNGFIQRWSGQEWELRKAQPTVAAQLAAARDAGDTENGIVYMGQDAGLIRDLPPVADLMERMVEDARTLLSDRLPGFVRER